MKYIEVYIEAVGKLKETGNSEANLDAWYLMEKVSGFSRADWFVRQSEEMDTQKHSEFEAMLKRLEKNEPVAYILGEQEFMGLRFKVDKNVLIPRQDTEHVTELAIKTAVEMSADIRQDKTGCSKCPEGIQSDKLNSSKVTIEAEKETGPKPTIKILDMCTGSGCIAISVKKFLDAKGVASEVTAADISEGALELAIHNAENNAVKINFMKSDMFSQISDTYDIIISNPPYIPICQLRELDKKVLDYEPENALYGGDDGLDFYRIIANDSTSHLSHGGRLLLEIGFDQGVTVPAILKEAGFSEIEVIRDYCGHDRVVKASWP